MVVVVVTPTVSALETGDCGTLDEGLGESSNWDTSPEAGSEDCVNSSSYASQATQYFLMPLRSDM